MNPIALHVDDHPLLHAGVFVTRFAAPLGDTPTPDAILALHDPAAAAPIRRDETVRGLSRDLLRHGGHKPTGRGKPASEYLVRASEGDGLPRINLAVDACNAVSLHSGLPISVVDLGLATAPFRIGVAGEGDAYVFNASGQEISLEGLLCLGDAEGWCANAVKDSQRTKTHAGTTATLSVVWGHRELADHVDAATRWYRDLLESADATTEGVAAG